MTKYVRTNNGVYDTKDYEVTKIISIYEPSHFKGINEGDLVLNVNCVYEKVIKQADTIEKLCDEYIYVNKIDGLDDKTHTISFEDIPNHQFTEPTLEEKLEYILKRYKDDLDKIKLGIWTDKGLIYVAKMNKEGKRELI